MDLYQSLVTVNPVTLIAQICNLFIQLLIVKIFFLDKIKATYEQNKKEAKAKADDILMNAQRTANSRSEEIISQAQATAAQIKSKASADIEMEKKKAINDAKNEISGLAMAIAGKIVERELNAADQSAMIDNFINELGDGV